MWSFAESLKNIQNKFYKILVILRKIKYFCFAFIQNRISNKKGISQDENHFEIYPERSYLPNEGR